MIVSKPEYELPLVSLITINYNSIADTIEFLESVKQLSYTFVEVIVVDNASHENPMQKLMDAHPSIHFIRSEKNLGFAGGNNLGILQAKGDFLFLLNNDTILPPNFLEPIIRFMLAHPDAGMASPKVLYPDAETIQYAGAIRISPFTGGGKRLGLFEKDHGQYNRNYKTDLGHGAALIFPRKILHEVGPMPEIYFLYYEEHDWCEQVKRLGYTMYYIGESYVIHKESVSVGGSESPLKVYYLTRNRILFMRRNSDGIYFILGILFFSFIALPKNLLKYVLKREFKLAQAYLKGIWWNLINYNINDFRQNSIQNKSI